ncbi:MAG: PP2C family protein-serine/threonine phosphatase [Phycisphaerales bacterium]|nr:PP2C family protein-serine/threonine phosphatase [Phycisphaerales bacterium]
MTDTPPVQLESFPAQVVDLAQNPKIIELASVLKAASSTTDPAQMLSQFGPWVANRSPRDAFVSISRRGLADGSYKFTRVMNNAGGSPDPENPTPSPWDSWDTLETHQGGLVWELIKTPEPKLINHVDLMQDPVFCKVLGPMCSELKAIAAIPAYENGQAINWSLSLYKDPEWNNLSEFEMGFLDLNMMGTATRNLVSRRKVEELNDELEKQLSEMGRIQRALIPATNPSLDGYSLATSYEPSMQAGGDFYDYFQFPDGRLGVMIADVAGHGAAAATVMAMMGAYIRAYGERQEIMQSEPDPVDAAKYLNAALLSSPLPSVFVTAFIAVLDPTSGTINWTRCGHNPPRIRGVDGTIRTLNEPGTLPLGVIEDIPALALSSTLEEGETLILYTDGITEASRPADNESGFEMFGEDGLDNALTKCTGQPECVIDSINTALNEFTGTNLQNDDRTMVVVRHTHPDDPS